MQASEYIPIEQIEAVVKGILREHLKDYLKSIIEEFVRENEQKAKELSLLERIIRVEEELKALKEIELARFEAIEKRFESLQREMNARFEALQREMNARFEAVAQRFEALEKRLNFIQWFIGIGFTLLSLLIVLFGFLRG